jgi:hypothetical protein
VKAERPARPVRFQLFAVARRLKKLLKPGRLFSSLGRELLCDGSCPTAVAQRMHLDPDPVLPFVQLQCARTAWNPKMPMMAAGAPGQFTLASNHEPASAALLEDLLGGEPKIEFEHGWVSS